MMQRTLKSRGFDCSSLSNREANDFTERRVSDSVLITKLEVDAASHLLTIVVKGTRKRYNFEGLRSRQAKVKRKR